MAMKRNLLSFVLIFALCFAAGAGPTGGSTRFDAAFQKALAGLSPEERGLVDSPILDHRAWWSYAREEAAQREEGYERMLPHATPEMKKEMAASFETGLQSLADQMCQDIIRQEQLARKLGYTNWLPPGTPLLQVFSLSADEIRERGLETPPGETGSPSFRMRSLESASRIDVDIQMKSTLEKTRMALLLPNDLSSTARDFRTCERPYGDACVARSAETAGIGRSAFKFARSNVFVELRGRTEVVERVAAWLDKCLQEQIAASGKAVEEVQKPAVVLAGAPPAPPLKADPARYLPAVRDEDVLVIEEPKRFDVLGAVVPDGTKTVTVHIRILDPRVTKVTVSFDRERKILEPVNGQVTATFLFVGTSTSIVAQAHMAPEGQSEDILGVASIPVMTESDHRALDQEWRERAATPAPRK
jgi:hypothetical protein